MSAEERNTLETEREPAPPPPLLPEVSENVDPEPPEWLRWIVKETNHRKWVGIGLGLFGVGTVAAVLCHSMSSIAQILKDVTQKEHVDVYKDAAIGPIAERITWFAIGGHTVIAVAAVFFGYSMLRAAERLLVPRHLLAEKRDVEVIRAILGLDTPAGAAISQAKALLSEGQALLKGVVDIVRPGSPPKPPEAG